MTRISLCLIAKNEARWLPKSLAAARLYVDQMVVVDTGSTDDTPKVAKAWGAEVTAFPWPDDFAVARNRSLELATGDWILVLDADEIIRGPNLLRSLARTGRDGEIDAYRIELLNYRSLADPHPAEKIFPVRFFRNNFAYRYHRRFDELLNIPGRLVGRVPSSLQIHHYGYTPGEIARKAKPQRNVPLLQEAWREEEDPGKALYHLFNLAGEFLTLGHPEEALALYTQVVRDPAAEELLRPLAHAFRLDCLLSLQRWDEAWDEAAGILRRFPDYTEVLLRQAQLLLRKGDPPAAERSLLEALRHPRARSWLLLPEPRVRARCWYELGNLYATQGRLRLATQCLAQAHLEKPPLADALPRLRQVFDLFSEADRQNWTALFLRQHPSLGPFFTTASSHSPTFDPKVSASEQEQK